MRGNARQVPLGTDHSPASCFGTAPPQRCFKGCTPANIRLTRVATGQKMVRRIKGGGLPGKSRNPSGTRRVKSRQDRIVTLMRRPYLANSGCSIVLRSGNMGFGKRFVSVALLFNLIATSLGACEWSAPEVSQSSLEREKSGAPGREDEAILPTAWIGTWRGEVRADSAQGPGGVFQMELSIAPINKPDRLSWTITYDGPQGKSVREYELVKKGDQPGHFVIDEKNSIEIDATLLGNALLSHFSVAGQTIWTKYALIGPESAEMDFELIAAPNESIGRTGGKDGVPEVASLRPASRQIARLKRVVASSEPAKESRKVLTEWTKLKTEAYRGKQDDIYFVDEQVGWYGNGAGKIFKTNDGGATWQLQHEKPGTFFRCLAFVDRQLGFAGNIGPDYFPNVTDDNPLYETRDGGDTWTAVTTIAGKPIVGLCALQVLREEFVNAGKLDVRTRLIGVGRVGGPAAMIISDDLGATWQPIDISAHAAMALDVCFLNRNVGFIAVATDVDVAKSHAAILRTADGGQTWQKVYESNRPYELTWKISFPTRETGYVTIQSYNPDSAVSARFVAKSEDGGKSWREIPLVDNHAVREFGIAFLDEKTGWVGAVPHGFFTDDGGQSWQKASLGNAVNKIRLLATESKTIGFAIGSEVHRIEIPKQSK